MVALNDLWIIRDVFVNKNYYMLPQMKHEAKSSHQPIPYIYEFFNVTCYTPHPDTMVKDVLAKFVNCTIKVLNDAVKLPRIILIIPDSDIVCFIRKITDQSEIQQFFDSALNWIINQMAKAIESSKDNLQRRRPGAILPYEPKMIWVKMFDRLGTSRHSKSMAYRATFNDSLENALAGKAGHFIMDIDQAMADVIYFDQFNHLNTYGVQNFWTAVDKQLERFEKRIIQLKPFGQHTNQHGNSSRRRGGVHKRGNQHSH